MENEKLFELMTKMYTEMQNGFKDVRADIKHIKLDVEELTNRVTKIEFKLEDLDKKVDLSLEGHKNNTEQLTRIENEVSCHEEVIIRRVN